MPRFFDAFAPSRALMLSCRKALRAQRRTFFKFLSFLRACLKNISLHESLCMHTDRYHKISKLEKSALSLNKS